jgi:cytidylate kinase
MKTKVRSIHQIVEEQVQRWQILKAEKKIEKETVTVITLSREPGSGGRIIARVLAKNLKYDLFDQEILHAMAENAKVSTRILQSLDERGLSMLDDWISSFVNERHLWPDQYLRHLMKVIGTIGRHGHAIILGRGANFILPSGKIFRIRIFAPFKTRVQNVSRTFAVPIDEARRRIIKTDSDRRAFVRKYFNADVSDPDCYDLTINTEHLSIDASVDAILGAFGKFQQKNWIEPQRTGSL